MLLCTQCVQHVQAGKEENENKIEEGKKGAGQNNKSEFKMKESSKFQMKKKTAKTASVLHHKAYTHTRARARTLTIRSILKEVFRVSFFIE